MNTHPVMDRRTFVRTVVVGGSGLVLGFMLGGCELPEQSPAGVTPTPAPAPFQPNAFLRIAVDGTVIVTVHRSEMGQGVRTAIPMLVAEELEVGLDMIRVEQADGDSRYGDQVTGGSASMQRVFTPLRQAGAIARSMLITAAAGRWEVPESECSAETGAVVHTPSGRRLGYGELAEAAAILPVPSSPPLKEPQQFRVIGSRVPRFDEPAFVSGRALFAGDIRLPGMLYALAARPPVFGATLNTFDDTAARAIPGVRNVIRLPFGVVVFAENTWSAIQGRDALNLTWELGKHAELGSSAIRATLEQTLHDASASDTIDAHQVIEAIYETPFAAHVPLEPMIAVADVQADRCEVWAPTQNPQLARSAVQSAVGVPTTLHVTLIGGGFGRRLEPDYAVEAALASKAAGAPVQLFWTRSDDIRHDYLRPTSMHLLRAGIDPAGAIVAWRHWVAGPGISGASPAGSDALREGLSPPYHIQNKIVRALWTDLPVPTGFWRSVYNVNNAFANEVFFDEVAAALGRDPLELRLELLGESRLAEPLRLAAERAGWGTPMPPGSGRGIACHSTWGVTHVAQIAEVSVHSGVLRVNRVVCAVDCGLVVNPDLVEAQMEGGIAFALTPVLKEPISIAGGAVRQSNFHDYPILRIDEMPEIDVIIVPGGTSPTGTGEMAVPPIAPAVANAVAAATGQPVRQLPIRPA